MAASGGAVVDRDEVQFRIKTIRSLYTTVRGHQSYWQCQQLWSRAHPSNFLDEFQTQPLDLLGRFVILGCRFISAVLALLDQTLEVTKV